MKYFYDTEFLEDGTTIDLISIGIVSEDGREYYAVNSALDDHHGSHSPIDARPDDGLGLRVSRHEWLMKNVVPHLPLRTSIQQYGSDRAYMPPNLDMTDVRVKPKWVIANEVRDFLRHDLPAGVVSGQDPSPVELWANYGAYDHVVLMQLWGPMIAKPKLLPMWTHDLQYLAEELGISGKEIDVESEDEHHALADARWNHRAYQWLKEV